MTIFRHAWNRMTVDEIVAEPRVVRLDEYWCGADKPEHVRVAPVYAGTKVPEDAECSTCGISIREVQAMVQRG